ncbi:hypothetical protein AC625_08880 [Peribacillus loiseleuriae]|uniref:Uncharacterized protein n=1 Tax=Peribacillus loiseleuriae TaxID=1679170 RepID=A0A0K9GSM2_9BACI|nr:hypothetical protein AC625_08880 [Peribacillus loiseleuriae]
MLLLTLWFLFLVSGLFYMPKREVQLNFINNKISLWFYIIEGVWAFITIFYIPIISNIILESAIISGLVDSEKDASTVIIVVSVILFTIAYIIYYKRLGYFKERYKKQDLNS